MVAVAGLVSTVVATAVATTTTATSSTAIATAAPVAPAVGLRAECGRHLLLGFEEDLHQVLGHLCGLVREEGHGQALGARPASTSDAVDVVLDVVGPVV